MPIRLRCPTCQEILHFDDDVAAGVTRCPQCENTLVARPAGVADTGLAAGADRKVDCPRCGLPMGGVAGTVVECEACGESVRVPGGRKFGEPLAADRESLAPPALGSTGTAPEIASPGLHDRLAVHHDAVANRDPTLYRNRGALAGVPSDSGRWRGAVAFAGERTDWTSLAEPLPSGRARWFYVMPGAVFLLFSLFIILLVLARVILPFLLLVRSELGPVAAEESDLVWAGLHTATGAFLGGALAAVYFLGGVALIRRRGLTMARWAAIAACIPCLNALVLTPIGIWACFLAFGRNARRDFDA